MNRKVTLLTLSALFGVLSLFSLITAVAQSTSVDFNLNGFPNNV